MFLSLGAFLPTMPIGKYGPVLIGTSSDYIRFQKYLPRVLTVYGNLAFHYIKDKGFIFGWEIGPNFMIPTEGDGEFEAYIHYALAAGYRLKSVDLKAELRGLGIITEDVEIFKDRFFHDLAFGVQWHRGKIRPGVFYIIYLKKPWSDNISGVTGLRVDVIL